MMQHTIQNRDVLNCLPLLASVLGKRYGVEVHIGGQIAGTDGRTIYLPSLPLDSDDELLTRVRGFIDHESAHIRFTDFETFERNAENPVLKYIVNAIEDWRVEKDMSGVFPGCRGNLNKLIPYLISEPYQTPKRPGMAILHAILRTVRRWDVPTINLSECLKFVEGHFPGLWPQIQDVLDKVQSQCFSTQDAVTFSREIMAIMQRYCNANTNTSESEADTPAPGIGSKDDQQSSDADRRDGENGTESTGPFQARNESSSGSSDQGTVEKLAGDEKEDQTPSCPVEGASETPVSKMSCQDPLGAAKITEKTASEVKELLKSAAADLPKTTGEYLQNALQKIGGNIPRNGALEVAKIEWKETSELSPEKMAEAGRTTTALRTRLQNLLQASTLQRSRPAQRGRLNSSGLYKMMIQDPKIFLDRENKKSIDTAIHILLDSSGSMSDRIQLAGRACYAVGKALEAVRGISVGISVFPSNKKGGIYPIVPQGKKVHNRFKMSAVGVTPLSEALWWTMQTMMFLPQTRKLILIITDGEPSNPDSTTFAIDKAQKIGFELYGIGIKSDNICKFLPNNSIAIQEMGDLPASMFTILQKALLLK